MPAFLPLVDRVLGAARPTDPVGEGVLDAALEQFLEYGLRRSSVEDVARRAGVARVTVYRRFPTKNDLMTAVVLREVRVALAEIERAVEALPAVEDKAVEGFVTAVRIARNQALLRRLLHTEPETVLPYLTIHAGPLLAVAREFLAAHIREAQAAGQVPRFEPEPVAEMLVRLTQSLVLTPDGVIDADDDEAVRSFARRYLFPIDAATRS